MFLSCSSSNDHCRIVALHVWGVRCNAVAYLELESVED
jgi:hypothetical protein